MNTNKYQIGLQSESRGVANPTLNLPVISVSDIFFENSLLINTEGFGDSSKFKIRKVNNMLDFDGNEVYGCIYKITNLMDGKCYIGKTVQEFKTYINDHFVNALRGDQPKKYFYNAIRKYGKHNFKYEILGFCNSGEELNEAEIEVIWLFRSFGSNGKTYDKIYGYNLTLGGEGCSGIKHTEEAKKKMSDAQKNKPPITENTRKKMSESAKGKKVSLETREKQSRIRKGKKSTMSFEEKKKRAEKSAKTTRDKGLLAKENHPLWGIGHSDEAKKKIKDNHYDCSGSNGSRAKDWKLTDPNNKEYFIKGTLKKFCIENNISIGVLKRNLGDIINKVRYKTERCLNTLGWKLEEI